MKLTVVLFFASMMVCLGSVHAQRVSLDYQGAQLKKVLVEISRQSGYTFIYDEADLSRSKPVTIRINNKDVAESLELLFKRQPLQFQIKGKSIAILPGGQTDQSAQTGLSQQKTVRGRVTDENSQPLAGVSVLVKGTTTGTVTDGEGAFTINVPSDNSILVFNYLGFAPQERSVTGQTTLSVRMKEQANALDELVVVSYGTQKRREISGSVATLSTKGLEDMPVMQFGQQLQGKVAGVNVAQTSGQPGRGVSFRIRGSASMTTDYQPLYVIDGMPITGSINNINPDEIESFSILKDASATALYGSRAANGVILITTKRGKTGENRIEFNSNYGLQKLNENRVPKMMNAAQFAQFMQQRFEDRVKYENFNPNNIPAEYQGDVSRYGKGTDWFDLLTQTAPIQSYSLNAFSGRERSNSGIMLNYQEQEGVVINTGTKLFSLRLNQDLSLANDKLKLGVNLAPSYRIDHNNRISSDGVNGYYQRIFESSPLVSPYQPDGSYTIGAFSNGMVAYVNPLALLKESQDDYITTRILGNAYANYEVLPGMTLKANLGIDKGAEMRSQYSPQVAVNTVATLPVLSTALSSAVDNFSYTGELFLTYNKTFATDHHLEGLIGYGVQKFEQQSNNVSGNNFPSDDIYYLSAAGAITGGSSAMTQYSMLSEIGRLNYNYKGKYFLQGSARRDGSSRFGKDRRFGWFPAISGAWIISEESFMAGIDNIDLLKLRASYGITGNNFFGNFTAISTLSRYNYLVNNAPVQGQTIGGLGNSLLGWERNKQLDLGVDVELLKNRISVTYDYYRKLSDALIQPRQIPRASGFTTIQSNVGQLQIWGHELSVNTANTTGKLQWSTNLNFSFERNKIKSLVDPGYIRRNNTVSSDYFRHQVGRSLGEFYGFVFLGLYKDAEDLANSPKYSSGNVRSDVGTLKMKDINGDGVIDDVNDRTFIGNPTPDFTFGMTNTFNYKNLDLSISMVGQVGGDILTPGKWAYLTNMDGSRVPLAAALDYWRSPENPGSGVYPRTLANTTVMGRQVNSQWVEDGTYLSANNISLGYRFNVKKNWLLNNFRLYASVQQAFIITNYSGYTPQIALTGNDALGGLGIDENAYPVPRTFSIGFTSTFK